MLTLCTLAGDEGGRRMNKIYFAVADEDEGGVYISAKNIKEAKKLAMTDSIISEYLINYIDLKCRWIKRYTDLPSKVMDIEEIIQEKIHWWYCVDCEQDDDFKYLNENNTDKYKCPYCGNIANVPYVNC